MTKPKIQFRYKFADGDDVVESLEAYIEREVRKRVDRQMEPIIELVAKLQARDKGGRPREWTGPPEFELIVRYLKLQASPHNLSAAAARTALKKEVAGLYHDVAERTVERWIAGALGSATRKARRAT